MTFVSHAQNFEDVVLWRALSDVEQGRYLDIGAQDPLVDSVSFAFYTLGWRGVHVEPTPTYAAQLRDARPDEVIIEAAVTDSPGPIKFYELVDTGLSTGRSDIAQQHQEAGYVSRTLLVPCVRLDHILEISGDVIHWMKIDVEGMEADVLRSWGDCPIRPWILVIEATYPNSQQPTHAQWSDLVVSRGYHEVFFDGLSRYFVHEAHRERETAFHAPANVFDGFAISRLHFSARPLRAEFEEVEKEAEQQAAFASELRSQVGQLEQQLLDETSCRDSLAADLANSVTKIREEQLRASTLASELDQSREHLLAARDREAAALKGLAEAEREHSVVIGDVWRERESAISNLRKEFGASAESLRAALDRVQERAAAVQVESARFDERAKHFEALLRRAEEERDRIRSRAELTHSEQARQISERDLAIENAHARLQDSQARLQRAEALLQAVRTAPLGRWLRVGKWLGLWRASPAHKALSSWSAAPDALSHPTNPNELQLNQAFASMIHTAPAAAGNPYYRANSLAELNAWEDIDFVRCAYVTVLGRQPDADGEAYYVKRLRDGEAKLQILFELRTSDEARLHDPGIGGFDRTLRRFRRARIPVVGAIVAPGYRRDWTSGERRMRRLENTLWRNHSHQLQLLRSIEQACLSRAAPAAQPSTSRLPEHAAGPNVDRLEGAQRATVSTRQDLLSLFSQSAVRNVRSKLSVE